MSSPNIKKVAADSNVLLSAISGRAARKVFEVETLVVITTEHNVAEIEEYVPYFAERYGLAPGLLLDVLTALPIEVYREHDYAAQLPLANQLLGYRDADDVALAALALNFQIPVWSNDRDFERFPTGVFTTATLLRFFGL